SLPLAEFGLQYIFPEVLAAHPFDDGTTAQLVQSITETASGLGRDEKAYMHLFSPLVENWPLIDTHILGPMLKLPKHPFALAQFGLKSLQSGKQIASRFRTKEARG